MRPEDVLLSIAEIAVGLGWFSGMIVAAILPFALSGISESPALIWGVPMVFYSGLAIQ